jgi:hypothetical protein
MFAVLSLLAQPDTRADILGFAGEDILSLSPWIGQRADGGDAFWVHQDGNVDKSEVDAGI